MGKVLMWNHYLVVSFWLFFFSSIAFASSDQEHLSSNNKQQTTIAVSTDMYLEHAELKRTIKSKPIPSDFMYNLRLQLDEADRYLVRDIILSVKEGLLFNFSFSGQAIPQKKNKED